MKNILLPLFISILFTTMGCWNEPLLTELGTNRLEVQLKGTYESNGPTRAWVKPTEGTGEYQQYVMDDSIDDLPYNVEDDFPVNLKFDIAEMRLKAANGKVTKFARYRKTFRVGVDDTDSFFNGDGVVMKNDDPVPGREYVAVLIYFRKIIFDQAKYYEIKHTGSGSSKVYDYDGGWMTSGDYSGDNLINVIFAENEEEGFDFNLLSTSYYWDTLRQEESDTNRIFPLEIPIEGGLVFDNKTNKTVLEIRLVMKNFLKKYEFDVMTYAPSYDDDLAAPVIAHYYAMSDWLRDVKAGENAIGGNLHAVARSYVEGETGTISAVVNAGPGYVIAIPGTEDIDNYYVSSSLRDSISLECEQPVAPSAPVSSISAHMDYWLKYEEYRIQWDRFADPATGCRNGATGDAEMDQFISEWNAYDGTSEDEDLSVDGAARKFKIPPYAIYVDTGDLGNTVTINNVTPGTYSVYYVSFTNDAAHYGTLPDALPTAGSIDIDVESGLTANGGTFD